MRVNASAYGRRPWHVRYDLKRLVYVERYERIIDAIQRRFQDEALAARMEGAADP